MERRLSNQGGDPALGAGQNLEEACHSLYVPDFDFGILASAVLSSRQAAIGPAVPDYPVVVGFLDDDRAGGTVVEHVFYVSERDLTV